MDDDALAQKILNHWPSSFVTGTTAWDHPRARDIDIVVPAQRIGVIEYVVETLNLNIYETLDDSYGDDREHGSVYIQNSRINVVCVSNDDYGHWKAATQMMKGIKPVNSRKARHGLFETLRGLAKALDLKARNQ